MPDSLATMLASFNDNTSGDISAADGRGIIQALYDWIPRDQKYRMGRLAGETPHADDDFFTAYSGYTEHSPTGTATWAHSRFGLTAAFNSQAGGDLAVAVKPLTPSSPPVTIETQWSATVKVDTNPGFGLAFTDGTVDASNVIGFGGLSNFSIAAPAGTLTSAASGPIAGTLERSYLHQGLFTARLIWTAANTFAWAISPDGGTTWTDWGSSTIAHTFTPDHIGFFVTGWGAATPNVVSFAYLRVYEADLSV